MGSVTNAAEATVQGILNQVARGDLSMEEGQAQLGRLRAFMAQAPADQATQVREAVRAEFAGESNVEPIAKFFEMLATGHVDPGTVRQRKATHKDIYDAAQHLFASHGSRFAVLAEKFDRVLTDFPGLAVATAVAKTVARSALIDVAFKAIPAPAGPFLAGCFKAFGNGGFTSLSRELSSVTDNKIVAATLDVLTTFGVDRFALKMLNGPIGQQLGHLGLGLLSDDKDRVTQQVNGILQTVTQYIHHVLRGKHPDSVEVGDLAGAGATR